MTVQVWYRYRYRYRYMYRYILLVQVDRVRDKVLVINPRHRK